MRHTTADRLTRNQNYFKLTAKPQAQKKLATKVGKKHSF